MKKFLSIMLAVLMVVTMIPFTPVAFAATVPNYIESVAVSYGAKESTPKNILTGKGYTVIDYDLNLDCGSRSMYIYMGYKTTTDPSKAITGIFFTTTDSAAAPANSSTFDGVTAYLLGGSTEPNPGEDTYVDLNKGASGDYIYTYVTRDSSRASVTEITFDASSSKSGYVTPVVDLNGDTRGDPIYLHYKQFSATVEATYYYLTSTGSRTSSTQSATVKNHLETMTKVPSVSTNVTYSGNTYTFKGWREDNTATSASTTSPSTTYMTTPKTYRAVYSRTLSLSYNANGGSGAPSTQTATQYINAGSSSVVKQNITFTIPKNTYTHPDKCNFLGWSTNKDATTASYNIGGTLSPTNNTTLYAIYDSTHNPAADDGDCTTEVVCLDCDKVTTASLSHTGGTATCKEKAKCETCGKEYGEIGYHNWVNTNGFCSHCNKLQPAEHGLDGVYEISNAGQLYWFAARVNSGDTEIDARLVENIVINEKVLTEEGRPYENYIPELIWTPIGSTSENSYTGTFEGNNKTISGLYLYDSSIENVGLFGYIAEGAGIQNLGVINSAFSGKKFVSGVVAYNSNGTVTGCYNEGYISGTKEFIGGVVGYSTGGTVTGCYNTGRVSGDYYDAGGVVGYIDEGTVTNCYNKGSVKGFYEAGGVVGYSRECTVTNCYNEGSVDGDDDIGGVVGDSYGCTVTDCYNEGSVDGNITVGGVTGNNNMTTMTNCYNTGSVRGYRYVGGVTGATYYTGTVANCYNTGSVTGDDYRVGGVTGYIYQSTVVNCYNTGDISGKSSVGGVAGDTSGSTMTNCYNIGSVSGDSRVGGVVGYNYDNDPVTNSYYLDTNGVSSYGTAKTEAQFKSGEVAYLLNGSSSEGELIWGQNLGTDAAPTFTGDVVYKVTCVDTAFYSNTDENIADHTDSNDDNLCDVCGAAIHVCDFSGEWLYDDEKHWKQCVCGLTSKEETHSGTATCTEKAKCEVCGESYGEVDANAHDWSNGNAICADCSKECTHENINGDSFCDICLYFYGEEISAGESHYVRGDKWLKFVPEVSGTYIFSSTGYGNPHVRLYDSSLNMLSSVDNGFGNFELEYEFIAGKVYYFDTKDHFGDATNQLKLECKTHTGDTQLCGGYKCDVCGVFYGEGTGEHIDADIDNSCDVCNCFVCDEIEPGVKYIVEKSKFVKFVPEASGKYSLSYFVSDGAYPYINLHNSDFNFLASVGYNSSEPEVIEYEFTAGEEYYFELKDHADIYGYQIKLVCETHKGGTQLCGGYKCEVCGEFYGEGTGEHTGGTATCVSGKICETCGTEYGEVDADNHDWSNSDGICANGCGTKCTHESCSDGVCDYCGLSTVSVVINMTDSYGDGWNGAKITIKEYIDGSFEEKAVATIENGDDGEFTIKLNKDATYVFIWEGGSYPDECAFEIYVDDVFVYWGTYPSVIEDQSIIYAICKHSGGTQDCGGYICEVCGLYYGEGTGEHTGGTATCKEQAKCEVCGKSYGELEEHDTYGSEQTCKGYYCNNCEEYVGEKDETKHSWYYGRCDICEEEYPDSENCEHDWSNGECSICGTVCPHEEYENGKCTVCGCYMAFELITGEDVTCYNSFSAALEAAEDGSTIKLIKNVVDSNSVEINKAITFDFNGNKWEQPSSGRHTVTANVTFIDSVGGGKTNYSIYIAAPCTFKGGTYENIRVVYETEDTLEDFLGDCYEYYDYYTDELLDLTGETETNTTVTIKESHTGGEATCVSGKICETCGTEYGEVDADNHDFDENGKCVGCNMQVAASTTIDGEVTNYLTLNEAINAVSNCTAEDKAVVKLLSDIDLGTSRQYIVSGEFTFDLNGHKITSEHVVFDISGESNPVVTFVDSSEAKTGGVFVEKEGDPEIGYQYIALNIGPAKVVIEGGTYSTDGLLDGNPITVSLGEVTIKGGTFYGCVSADYQSSMDIYGGTFINTQEYGYCVNSGLEADVNIYGGEFTASGYDCGALIAISGKLTVYGGTFTADTHLTADDKNIILTLAEGKTEGATFSNGLKALYYKDAALADSLADGMAYWQGDKMILLAEGQSEITGGDVVIKAYVEPVYSGWTEIDGSWYYYDSESKKFATGITRVPYPTEKIDGVSYAANADDKAYWESHKETSSYTDAETAFFVFGEDGKFNPVTGIVDGNRYALKGMIGWHPGLVEVEGDYYYFLGDKNGGGNVMATGDTYVTRGTTDEFVYGGIYTFGEDGKLCEYDGITEVDGVLRYYKDNRLATGEGLIKVDGDYYYVRTNGELVVNKKYWVSKVNGYSIVAGEYLFDESGKLINPIDTEVYNGIIKIDGNYYYYINGKKQANTGVQKLTDEEGKTFYIYVTSGGKLATGDYWPTNRNDLLDRGCYDWGTDGKYYPTVPEKKDGIVEIGGKYYYYINGKKQANTGVQKLTDENGKEFYIYVRSNGELATGNYWPTKLNNLLDRGNYNWGTDGKYYPPAVTEKNGIMEVDGKYYYYIDGKKQANTGVQKLTDENGKEFYIYVRSNGELATGDYWPTNRNDLLDRGCYDWGTDGRYYPA